MGSRILTDRKAKSQCGIEFKNYGSHIGIKRNIIINRWIYSYALYDCSLCDWDDQIWNRLIYEEVRRELVMILYMIDFQ